MNDFELTTAQLLDTAAIFQTRIEKGLAEDGQELKCLATRIPSIQPPDHGDAYALDLGGTNVRAAAIRFENGSYRISSGPIGETMGWKRKEPFDRNTYLNTQSKVLADLRCTMTCPLGYCFSFPAISKPDGDAELIEWTKEIIVPGVVGENVGRMLLKHLSEHYPAVTCNKVAVVNDTVASLIAGLTGPKVDAYIGLIVGTGTNMATFMPAAGIPKETQHTEGILPVNLESGNFTPAYLTRWDERIDKKSVNIGQQRFEKAVSGTYLGRILNEIYPGAVADPDNGAKEIADLIAASDTSEKASTATRIYDRSAMLVAAALAGLIGFLNSSDQIGSVRIVAEGSLFWGEINNTPRYLNLTKSTLRRLLNESGCRLVNFEFEKIENTNLLGSAIAALSLSPKGL